MISRRMLRPSLALAALAIFAAGCATPPPAPVSMRDPAVNFGMFKTFGWVTNAGPGGSPLSLLDQNIRAAITTQLAARGYVAATDKPDLLIAFEAGSAEKLGNNPVRVGVGIGGWSGNMGGSVNVGSSSVQKYKEGSLVIHAVDAARNVEVWQGQVAGKLPKTGADPAVISQAVAKAMRDFPARPAPAQ
jgi:hypothetical protein